MYSKYSTLKEKKITEESILNAISTLIRGTLVIYAINKLITEKRVSIIYK